MLYLVAIVIPPLAVLLCGKPFQAIFNLILLIFGILIFIGTLGLANGITFVIWIACIAHGMFIVHGRNQDRRNNASNAALSPFWACLIRSASSAGSLI